MGTICGVHETLRPRMLAIAYRMTGSVAEAEDIVQDAFERLHREGEAEVASPRAWLTTVTTRLSIDHLRSARARREQYTGQWLPEPVVTDPAPGPHEAAESAEAISLALLVVLETLSPLERAVFLLHEVFDYGYDEIAAIIERSPAACRQLGSRARRHVEARRPRFEPSREAREALVRRFLAAMQDGDTEALLSMLAEDAVVHGDGGGRVPRGAAARQGARDRRPAHGRARPSGAAGGRRDRGRGAQRPARHHRPRRGRRGARRDGLRRRGRRRADHPLRHQPGEAGTPRQDRRHAPAAARGAG
jgi:RNA polymerase sigma factor (sigma-70 family)